MAKQNLVPIKVKIGLRANGHADHPDWYQLPLASAEDPSHHMFFGWKYDKTSGHKEDSVDSPYGQQWGMVMVTPKFTKQALTTFPTLVTELTEAEAESFWDNKAMAHIPENKAAPGVLQDLQSELSLRESLGQDTTALKAKIAKALDPDDSEPGLRKNQTKYFTDAKTQLGIKVVNSNFTEIG